MVLNINDDDDDDEDGGIGSLFIIRLLSERRREKERFVWIILISRTSSSVEIFHFPMTNDFFIFFF
jgi:hypothetical protein